MPRAVFRFTLPAMALLGVSCSPYHASSGSQPLLVDKEARRYGQVIQHPGSRAIPIVRGDGIAELFVPVQIGTSRGWWQIDTGAAFCVVTPRIARHEGFVPITEGEIVTAAGAVDSQLGTLPSVRIGSLEIRQVTALSLRDDYAEEFTVHGRRGHVIGILGSDLLDHLGATVDLHANLLQLKAP